MKVNTRLAKLKHEKAQHSQRVSDYIAFFSKKQGSFKGIKKTFVPRDGFEIDPNYTTNVGVVTTVDEKFDWFNDAFSPRSIPVREDNVIWNPTTNDEYSGRKIFETDVIKGQTRTGENEEIILKDPNVDPQHLPANYQAKTTIKRRQVVTGDYTVQNFTGEWTHRQRAELLNRKSKLLGAVIEALKDINDIESVETGLDVDKFIGYLTYGRDYLKSGKKD